MKISYSGQFESRIKTKEYLLLNTPYSEWSKGVKHNIPITLPSFRLLNHINVVPSFSYNERWYFDYIDKYWVSGYSTTNPETGLQKWVPGHVEEVKKDGFKRNYEYRYSISSSTTIYGMYTMKNPNSKIKAVRHKIDPSIGFSYRPDFSEDRFGFYDWVQVDSLGNLEQYSLYENGIYGYTRGGRSGSVNFSLNNNIEMKVANENDTTSEDSFKKIAIFDNLGISSSYNLAAESFNLSPFSLNARTKIAGTSINISGTLDPYALDEKGKKIDEYQWNTETGISRLGRLTNVGTGFSLSYSSDKLKKALEKNSKSENSDNESSNNENIDGETENMPSTSTNDENTSLKYVPFEPSWRVSANYTFRYSNPSGKANWTQSVSLNGSLDLTPKWKTTLSSGFDFIAKELTHTRMTVTRDLHCWTMSFEFSPFGQRKYYSFTIRANASLLQDLKIDKTERSFY